MVCVRVAQGCRENSEERPRSFNCRYGRRRVRQTHKSRPRDYQPDRRVEWRNGSAVSHLFCILFGSHLGEIVWRSWHPRNLHESVEHTIRGEGRLEIRLLVSITVVVLQIASKSFVGSLTIVPTLRYFGNLRNLIRTWVVLLVLVVRYSEDSIPEKTNEILWDLNCWYELAIAVPTSRFGSTVDSRATPSHFITAVSTQYLPARAISFVKANNPEIKYTMRDLM